MRSSSRNSAANKPNGGGWHRVAASRPCPICNKPDWCSVSSDGRLVACRRSEPGCYKSKTDRSGVPFYLHRLDGTATITPTPPPAPSGHAPERADADTLNLVYDALLAGLSLAKRHRDDLRRRGLADAEIDHRGYRTLAGQGRARLARELHERFGELVMRVPGFVVRQRDGRRYLTIAGNAGVVIPVRTNATGGVCALLARPDKQQAKRKYVYLTSTNDGGPSPGAPPHVPLGVIEPAEIVRLTEGTLKADVAYALSGVPTVGCAGLGWKAAVPLLHSLGARTIRLAFDNDAADKPSVGRALAAAAQALAAEGFTVELERWPADHKGIDDALAASAAIEVLTGDAARQAIAETLTEATAGEEPQEPTALNRLADVLASGGVEALFRDGELLRALAELAETDPAEFACRRTQLQREGVKVRDLDRALAPHRQEIRREHSPLDAEGCYRIAGGRIVRDALNRDGPVEVPLANWHGRIVEEVVHDDGAEQRITLTVEGALADGTPLLATEVPADQFAFMRWPVEKWGTRAVVFAGAGTADHLRVALQLLSGSAPRRVVYGHTGWREIGGGWCYLHVGGAIGAAGAVEGVAVELPEALALFNLPAPPETTALVESIRSSLKLLDLAPDRITVPGVAAVYRAALGAADFSLHDAGPSGVFKTEWAALLQQHFGAGLNSRNLPASWTSTGNANEALAFAAKDALLVVDDFAPTGPAAEVQRYHREADRLLRAQGNRAGRGRCRADGSLKAGKAPRGLILSTGEDVPRGQSIRARTFIVELSKGDIDVAKLTAAQHDAAAGLYASCMAGFLRWLASRYADIHAGLGKEQAELREKSLVDGDGSHARTPGIVADLALGLRYFLAFAVEAGAVTPAERDTLISRCWDALGEAAAAQAQHVQAAEPCGQFLRLLAGAVASGRVHVASPDGMLPNDPAEWGWRRNDQGQPQSKGAWLPQGRRIGWVDKADLYLEPETAFAEAQGLAREQGDSVSITARTLWKRLRDRGLLASWDQPRKRNTVRKKLEGRKDRDVLHLRADALSTCTEPSEPSAKLSDDQEKQAQWTVLADSAADTSADLDQNRPQEPSAEHAETVGGGRFGRSDTGKIGPPPPNSAPRRKRKEGVV